MKMTCRAIILSFAVVFLAPLTEASAQQATGVVELPGGFKLAFGTFAKVLGASGGSTFIPPFAAKSPFSAPPTVVVTPRMLNCGLSCSPQQLNPKLVTVTITNVLVDEFAVFSEDQGNKDLVIDWIAIGK
jgi:hypothetical protein